MLQSFKIPSINASTFRDNFFRIFLIKLSYPEIGVLMKILDPELSKKHLLDGNKFLTAFFKFERLFERFVLGEIEESKITLDIMKIEDNAQSNSFKKSPSKRFNDSESRPTTSGETDVGRPPMTPKTAKRLGMIAALFGGVNPWENIEV